MTGRLAVIGAGLMGSGIAQVSAQAGWQVTMRDVDDSCLARGTGAIRGAVLHAVDALALVHAIILLLQALLLPFQTLVFSGH